MYWESADDVIRREIQNVRARRVILEELETGPKNGNHLRDKIRDAMIAAAEENGKEVDPGEVVVTDPKLYYNTKHLETLGIITSRKESQERIYRLHPRAIQPVRRVLNVTLPTAVVTSISRPDDARPLVRWFAMDAEFHYNRLVLVVEKARFGKGVSKGLERYVPDGVTKRWEKVWHELPESVVGYYEGGKSGDLMSTYAHVEKILLEEITENNVVFDLSFAPPIIGIAFCLLSNDYGVQAMFQQRDIDRKTTVTHYIPGEGLM